MIGSPRKLSTLIGLLVLAGVTTLILVAVSACVINALPRSMEGEAVLAPWLVCVVGSLVMSLLLPWVVSFLLLRRSSRRFYFLFCLVLSNAACYSLFGLGMLSEAYRRGL